MQGAQATREIYSPGSGTFQSQQLLLDVLPRPMPVESENLLCHFTCANCVILKSTLPNPLLQAFRRTPLCRSPFLFRAANLSHRDSIIETQQLAISTGTCTVSISARPSSLGEGHVPDGVDGRNHAAGLMRTQGRLKANPLSQSSAPNGASHVHHTLRFSISCHQGDVVESHSLEVRDVTKGSCHWMPYSSHMPPKGVFVLEIFFSTPVPSYQSLQSSLSTAEPRGLFLDSETVLHIKRNGKSAGTRMNRDSSA